MKRTICKIGILLTGILCMLVAMKIPAQAQEKEYQGLQYHCEAYAYKKNVCPNWVRQDIVITGYSGREKTVIIPEEIDGKPVTTIATGCFAGNNHIETVLIPDTVTQIGRAVFKNCRNLRSVRLPGGIEEIPQGAFAYCKKLETIAIPWECETIGAEAFYHCTSLRTVERLEVTDPDNNFQVVFIEEAAFEGCTKLEELKVSESMKARVIHPFGNISSIGDRAFMNCKKLKSFDLYGTGVGAWAFYGCTSLEKVINVPWTVQEKTFYGCKRLKCIEFDVDEAYIKNNTGNVERGAFQKIHPKAVFKVPKGYVKKWKKVLTPKTGFQPTMKVVNHHI